jgi:hypothetical protein
MFYNRGVQSIQGSACLDLNQEEALNVTFIGGGPAQEKDRAHSGIEKEGRSEEERGREEIHEEIGQEGCSRASRTTQSRTRLEQSGPHYGTNSSQVSGTVGVDKGGSWNSAGLRWSGPDPNSEESRTQECAAFF